MPRIAVPSPRLATSILGAAAPAAIGQVGEEDARAEITVPSPHPSGARTSTNAGSGEAVASMRSLAGSPMTTCSRSGPVGSILAPSRGAAGQASREPTRMGSPSARGQHPHGSTDRDGSRRS